MGWMRATISSLVTEVGLAFDVMVMAFLVGPDRPRGSNVTSSVSLSPGRYCRRLSVGTVHPHPALMSEMMRVSLPVFVNRKLPACFLVSVIGPKS
jgi:hypothetical protein